MTIASNYEEGVLKPLEEVTIKEKTVVELRLSFVRPPPEGQITVRWGFAFYGLWKDRADIGDSVEYVSNLRRELRG